MIKARADLNGRPTVFLGITGENVTRLAAGEPILVDLAELGVPELQVVIMYGKTERHIAAEMERHGMLPAGTASDMPEPRPGNPVTGTL